MWGDLPLQEGVAYRLASLSQEAAAETVLGYGSSEMQPASGSSIQKLLIAMLCGEHGRSRSLGRRGWPVLAAFPLVEAVASSHVYGAPKQRHSATASSESLPMRVGKRG